MSLKRHQVPTCLISTTGVISEVQPHRGHEQISIYTVKEQKELKFKSKCQQTCMFPLIEVSQHQSSDIKNKLECSIFRNALLHGK